MSVVERAGRFVATVRSPGVRGGEGRAKPGSFGPTGQSVLWTLHPGKGNGSLMLRTVCRLADRHGIELVLKTLPFGRKPYPLSREQLLLWYKRHGFEPWGRKLIRRPRTPATSLVPAGA